MLERTGDDNEEPKHLVDVDNCRIDDRIEYVMAILTDNEEVRFEDLFKNDKRE